MLGIFVFKIKEPPLFSMPAPGARIRGYNLPWECEGVDRRRGTRRGNAKDLRTLVFGL